MVRSRPTVIISAAISVDGKIATRNGDSGISSEKDLVRMHRLRSMADAVLIGTNTLRRDDPLLTVRHTRGKNPTRIILDSHGTIRSESMILRTAECVPTIIAVSHSASKAHLRRLEKLPVDVIVCGQKRVHIKTLLQRLHLRNIDTLLVEGGGTVNWEFIKNGLFDRLVITVSPRIIGGTGAVSLVEGTGFASVCTSAKLHLDKTRRIGDELVLYYSRISR